MIGPSNTLRAAIEPLINADELASRWRRLEAQAERSFFLSWPWIETAITSAPTPPSLLSVRDTNGQDIGLGVIFPYLDRRHKFLSVPQLRFHEPRWGPNESNPAEYNALLALRGAEMTVWRAFLNSLLHIEDAHWREIVFEHAAPTLEKAARAHRLPLYRHAQNPTAAVNLKDLRERGVDDLDGYINTLGKNTRSQLRRSIRLYQERGDIQIKRATDIETARIFFSELCRLHQTRWRAVNRDGVQSRPNLKAFLLRLLDRAFTAQTPFVELSCITAGGDAIGYVLNFVDRGRVYFYIGGFHPEADNRYKPGLVSHAFIISDHLRNGKDLYDFMAGGDRYKFNLGAPGPDLVSFAIQRRNMAMRFEAMGRQFKNSVLERMRA